MHSIYILPRMKCSSAHNLTHVDFKSHSYCMDTQSSQSKNFVSIMGFDYFICGTAHSENIFMQDLPNTCFHQG